MLELPLVEAEFRAMGSACRIVCDLDNAALFAAVHRIEDLESRWSRFRSDSEISRLNAARGQWVEVSAITGHLIERAVDAAARTGGLFNPLMLGQLEALGYDRSFEAISPTANSDQLSTPGSVALIESEGGAVRLPAGASFDPGGLGKGLAVDLVSADLVDAGATWVLVSMGGDMRFGGSNLVATGWQVDVENPHRPSDISGTLPIRSGAVATSSTLKRTWQTADGAAHHLLDPRTGCPADSSRVVATVTADEAWWADVVAKCLIIDDSIGVDRLDDWGATAVVFTADGNEGPDALGSALREPIVH